MTGFGKGWLPPNQVEAGWLAVGAAFFHGGAARAEENILIIEKDKDAFITVSAGNRPVFRYRCESNPMKPYADQLFSPSGVQVLRNSPHDHKHHHGLMYALAVDGVNFWEELKTSGREISKSVGDVKSTVHDGRGRAGFVQQLEWVGPNSDKPMLIERRAIDVLAAGDLGATLVEWRCRLQTPPGKDAVTLTGSHYFGLGMRFLTSMDAGGRFFNAEDKPGQLVRADSWLTPVKWCAYTAKADGRPVTAAMFDHPDNLRHPATFFTMTKAFAYLSATLNEWKEPIVVKSDKPLDLCYGVALWDGEADKATVEKLYQRWLQLQNFGKKAKR